MHLNRVSLIGILVREPHVHTLTSGARETRFVLATDHVWQESNMPHQSVEYHAVVAPGKLGEIVAQYVTKGSRVYVEGRLQTRRTPTARNTEVLATNLILLGTRKRRSNEREGA